MRGDGVRPILGETDVTPAFLANSGGVGTILAPGTPSTLDCDQTRFTGQVYLVRARCGQHSDVRG
jgi:hypothetical protein